MTRAVLLLSAGSVVVDQTDPELVIVPGAAALPVMERLAVSPLTIEPSDHRTVLLLTVHEPREQVAARFEILPAKRLVRTTFSANAGPWFVTVTVNVMLLPTPIVCWGPAWVVPRLAVEALSGAIKE